MGNDQLWYRFGGSNERLWPVDLPLLFSALDAKFHYMICIRMLYGI